MVVGVLPQIALKTIIEPNITNIIKSKQPKFIDFKKSPSFDFTIGFMLRNGWPQFGQAPALSETLWLHSLHEISIDH